MKEDKEYKIYWYCKSTGVSGESKEPVDYAAAKSWAEELNKIYDGKNGKPLIVHVVANMNYTA